MKLNQTSTTKFYLGKLILAIFVASQLITISIRIAYLKLLRSYDITHFNDEKVEPSYDDYINAKLETTVEFIDNILYMKQQVQRINKEQLIYNTDRYGTTKSSTFIIVIQVRDKIIYLKELVQSLKEVIGINNALLIFSHDNYEEDVNAFIRNITFAKFTQIFYPFSTQLHPKVFPGDDRKFCTKDFNCINSSRRQSILAQKKHHWWWQANYIFDHLQVTKDYNGMIVFLEEDQYVLADLVYMLKVLESLIPESCPQCEIISLGARSPVPWQFHDTDRTMTVEPWTAALHSIGIAFNRTIWKNLRENRHNFCYFNDYRWHASLRYLASKSSKGTFTILSSDGPRVIRFKKCSGINTPCSLKNNVDEAKIFAKTVTRGLFPRNVMLDICNGDKENVTEIGHWEDVRDQELCVYFTYSKLLYENV